jgi:hypothetical protein
MNIYLTNKKRPFLFQQETFPGYFYAYFDTGIIFNILD